MNDDTERSVASAGSLLATANDFRMQIGPFEIRCDRADWLPEYLAHHGHRLKNGVGFFHMHEWLAQRGIASTHRVVWEGWGRVRWWLLAKAIMALFPFVRKTGMTEGYYG